MYSICGITEELLFNSYVNKISTGKKETGEEYGFACLINGKKMRLKLDEETNLIKATIWKSWDSKEQSYLGKYLIDRHCLGDFIKIHAQGLFQLRLEQSTKEEEKEKMIARVYNGDNHLIYEFYLSKEDSLIEVARDNGFLLVNFYSDRAEAFLV